jgi:hypothetical protein
MHGSCIDKSLFSQYTEAIMKNDFSYCDVLLGQKLKNNISTFDFILSIFINCVLVRLIQILQKIDYCRDTTNLYLAFIFRNLF